jgi:hypothetical protein
MRLFEVLQEAPLPDDWDKSRMKSNTSFASRIQYAKERAKQIGRGSSRVAFETPYQGRKTVLKIALNSKGMLQNSEEINFLDDHYIAQLGIVIPLIDYDTENNSPTWIHTEFAEKISQKQLEKYFGVEYMQTVMDFLNYQTGRSKRKPSHVPEELHDNEYFQALQDLIVNFGIPADDLARKANWGLYKGKPVIIDLGWTDTTAKLYGR